MSLVMARRCNKRVDPRPHVVQKDLISERVENGHV